MEISLKQFADKHNKVKTRRQKKMSESYIYRLIRQHAAGTNTRELWFKYIFKGDKDAIKIIV